MKTTKQKSEVRSQKSDEVGDAVERIPTETRLEFVSRECIQPSRTNPRKTFDSAYLKELAESIRIHGIKQPLLVRPLPKYELGEPDMMDDTWCISKEIEGGVRQIVETFPNNKAGENAARMFMSEYAKHRFELVCGECRWRASGLAEMTTVPVLVENLDDKAVLEIQLIENDQRQDLNVMERAEGYQKLRTELGYTEEDIIKKTGKGRSTVYEILSLLKASEPVRAAIANGKIPETVGRLLAKIPGEKNQAKALKEVLEGGGWVYDEEKEESEKQPMSYRAALLHIRENYTSDLKEATFDPDDENYPNDKPGRFDIFTPQLPSCTKCDRRSGNCREEFPEIKNPRICTNPECFKLKSKLHEERIIAKAKESGASDVLTGKAAQKVFDYGGDVRMESGFLTRDMVWPGMKKPVGDLLKGDMPAPVIALVDGKQKKLFKRAEIEKALKDAGHNPKPIKAEQTSARDWREAEIKQQEKKKKNGAIAAEALPLLLAAVEKKVGTVELLRELAHNSSIYHYSQRHNIPEKAVQKKINGMNEAELRVFLFEAEFLHELVCWNGDFSSRFQQQCERFKIDLKKIGNELKLDDKPAEEPATKTQTKTKGAKAKK